MATFLIRGGFLIIVGTVVYLAVAEALLDGADEVLVRRLLLAGGGTLAGGIVLKIVGRLMAALVARTCPRCGRTVARGRVYCDDHRAEAINEYRDRDRERRGGG